jgi:hypothetical protein
MRIAASRSGWTRPELAVVLVAIGLLLGLIPSCIYNTQGPNNRAHCQNNLKQLALAVHNYAMTYEDKLPPAYARKPMDGKMVGGSILFWLLPYLEQDAIYRRACTNGGANSGGNWTGDPGPLTSPIIALACPSDLTNPAGNYARSAFTSYAANYLLFGYGSTVEPYDDAHTRLSPYKISDIPDGTSETVMWSEHSAVSINGGIRLTMMYGPDNGGLPPDGVLPLFNYQDHATSQPKWDGKGEPDGIGTQFWMPQYEPTGVSGSNVAAYNMVQGYHTAVLIVGMADGSVRGVNPSVSRLTWARAIYPRDKQELGQDW